MSVGDLAGSVSWICPNPDGGTYTATFPVPDGERSGGSMTNHVAEAIATDPANRSVFRITGWTVSGNGTSATKTYTCGDPFEESTTLTLRRVDTP